MYFCSLILLVACCLLGYPLTLGDLLLFLFLAFPHPYPIHLQWDESPWL